MRQSIAALTRSGSVGALAVTAAAALMLTGCGNGSDGSNNADQSSATSSGSASTSASGTAQPSSSAPTTTAPSSSAASPSSQPSPSASGAPSAGGGSQGSHSAGSIRCHTGDLQATLKSQDAAAGNRYATLVLTNTSGKACRIYGYGGIKLGGHAVPSAQHRDPSTPPQLISLAPGGHAYSTLHWGAVQGTGDAQSGQCEPTPSYLLVTPPDETTSLRAAWHFGPVCERGAIDQTAYRAGAGPARPGD